jgi:sterol desaturase/sphingolipid hydroxylase (fatty acid hydroxylase superfamily)
MRLSKTGYYADFAIYGAVLAAAPVITVWYDSPYELSLWVLAAVVGSLSWTLAEYLVHRFVLHQVPGFTRIHDIHHDAPLAIVGTPTWLSLSLFLGAVFLPTWALGSLNTASGLTIGMMAGFFWYGVAHHAIHHRRPRALAARLLLASRRHARHHYSSQPGNYGITTSFWDHVFGTALESAAPRSDPA